MGRAERVNQIVQAHDPQLFVKSMDGKLCILRKCWKWEPFEVDGQEYSFVRPNHFFIMAITSDWRFQSEPVDRGLIPIVERLKEIDLWNRDMAKEIEDQDVRQREVESKRRMSQTEDFLKEFRPQFSRATNEINTASLSKKDFRRNYEKRIKE